MSYDWKLVLVYWLSHTKTVVLSDLTKPVSNIYRKKSNQLQQIF